MAYASYKWSKESKRDELRNVGLDLIGLGVRLMPLGGNLKKGEEKKPLYRFLPRNPDNENKASWKMLASQGPTTPQMIDAWLAGGACGFAALTGHLFSNSLYIFDFDVEGYFEKWIANTKVNAILRNSKAFVQKTGGGGYQVFLFLEGKTPANKQYAWHPCDNEQGRVIAIESRGRGGYAVGPRSAHPSGNEYKPLDMFDGTLKEMTRISEDDFKILEDVATSLCQVPKSKKQIEREKRNQERERERATRAASKPRYASSDHGDVIGRFNHDNDIETILLQNGYSRGVGGRLSRPDAPKNSGSGVVLYHGDNKSFHYSSNDDLNDGYAKTPFDVELHFRFDGDMTRAIKELAEEYGIDHASTRQTSRRSKDYFDVRHALPSVVTSDVPSWFASAPLPFAHVAHAAHAANTAHAAHAGDTAHTTDTAHAAHAAHDIPHDIGHDIGHDYAHDMTMPSWLNNAPPIEHHRSEPNGIINVAGNNIDHDQLLVDCAITAPPSPTVEPDMLPITAIKKYSWPKYKADKFVSLLDGQYVSDIFSFNSVPMGQTWAIQSGTGTGKTTAANNQLDNFVMAVPLVGQVKQFVRRFGGAGLYEGQPLAAHSRKHFSTYDSLQRLIKAHKKGDINLKEKTAIIDEAHHIALDSFKDSEVFGQLIEFVELCGRTVFMTGTMPPLNPVSFDHKIEIIRPKPVKPLVSALTKDLAHSLECLRIEHKNHMLDVHFNDKKGHYAYINELSTLNDSLKMLSFSKITEENEAEHHMRILNGDGYIAKNVDIIFRTSILDDGIDIFTHRPVISVVVSNVTPLTIEQAGARFRNNLPSVTYSIRLSDNRKDEEKENDYFYMEREYNERVKKAKSRIEHIKALLEIEKGAEKLRDCATVAQKIMWGKLLDEYEIKGDEVTINKIAILQSITAKWGYYCKRNDDALAEALDVYGYEFNGFKIFKSGKGITTRNEKRRDDKKAKKQEETEKIRQASRGFDTITDVEAITTRYSQKKQKTEVHKAADMVSQFYDAGLTFEASKQIIEDAMSFHGRAIGNTQKAINASCFYHALARGQAEYTPSGQALARLYSWLDSKLFLDENFTAEEWAEEIFKASVWAKDDLAKDNLFDLKASPKALKDRRGQLLSSLVVLGGKTTSHENGKKKDLYSVSAIPRFSDSHFRDDLTFVGVDSCDASKITINALEKNDFTSVKPSNLEKNEDKILELDPILSETDDNVRNESSEKGPDDIILGRISRLLDDEDYKEALIIVEDISDDVAKMRTRRYIVARRKEQKRQKELKAAKSKKQK